jgi:membrane-associated phospholipid phosphatase
MAQTQQPIKSESAFDQRVRAGRHRLNRRFLFLGLAVVLIIVFLLMSGRLSFISPALPFQSSIAPAALIEPKAGAWQTWVLPSGSQLRPAPPPDRAATAQEIQALQTLAAQRSAAALDQIRFWDTGGPAHRWNEQAINEALKNNLNANLGSRMMALIHVAAYDATIAAWDAKYTYNRPRPSELDGTLETVIANPRSPSYPSEYAAVAGSVSAVLAYLFPDDAKLLNDQADAATRSRLLAGVEYPSDVQAGLALGRAVAAQVIERAKRDGSDAKWTGSVPTEPGHWNGTNPIMPMAGTWQTWVLRSGGELRPAPPPAYDSKQETDELAELKNIQRTPKMMADAFFWEYASGGTRNYWYWNEQTTKKILEYRLDANPPQEARAYALESIAVYDTGVACWDAKYAYWAIRPVQLDPTLKPLFPTPNHPSYPAAHACFSTGAATTLAHLFPRDAPSFKALADVAGESRIWAGIHFRSDVNAGQSLGSAVAQKVIERAKSDGAQ